MRFMGSAQMPGDILVPFYAGADTNWYMAEMGDHELLAEFARVNSEAAFAELVGRHADLVYSVALRESGNAQSAEEIAQAVFVVLARKAGSLSSRISLPGWLYQTARLTARNYRRGEVRRIRREQEAFMESSNTVTEEAASWQSIVPLLDEALGRLSAGDRNALVLRFLQGRLLREVGSALGLNEPAAKMRVNRALEKLRRYFGRHGIAMSVALISSAVAANAVQSAPAHLKAASVVGGLGATGSSATLPALAKATLQYWVRQKILIGTAAVLTLLSVITGILQRAAPNSRSNSSQRIVQLPVNPNAIVGQARAGVSRFKLLGTPNLAVKVDYTVDGTTKTASVTVPAEVEIEGDGFTATVTVLQAGEFGFELYRGEMLMGSASTAPVKSGGYGNITMKPGGRGIEMSGKWR
jgi:RNA polymerase sigma factor (sigma-70 family)